MLQQNYLVRKKFLEKLLIIEITKIDVRIDKPVNLGFSMNEYIWKNIMMHANCVTCNYYPRYIIIHIKNFIQRY